MRRTTLTLVILTAATATAAADDPSASTRTVPRGTRAYYGTNFGNRYSYFGLGYGYGPGAFGPGGGSGYYGGYGGRYGRYGRYGGFGGYGGGYGRYGGYGGYGGYGYGGYGGYGGDLGLQALHQNEMMWTMNFAPIPQMPPTMTFSSGWNQTPKRSADDFHWAQEPPDHPETITNPFVHSDEK
ncbi:MAG TPA: hypothetical protein VG826_01240 [Pirellulales bacterium]|nr:hypothetical protein [Pirellulales bacterium]